MAYSQFFLSLFRCTCTMSEKIDTHIFTFDCEFLTFVRLIQIISSHYNLKRFSELDEVTQSKKNCHIMLYNFKEDKLG